MKALEDSNNHYYLLASCCICKILMISEKVLLVPRILLHLLVVFDTLEHYLAETVEVGNVRHLAIVDRRHQIAGLDGIVNLKAAFSKILAVLGGWELITYYSPPLDSILDHQIFGHGRGYFDHVSTIGLLTHTRLSIAKDGET